MSHAIAPILLGLLLAFTPLHGALAQCGPDGSDPYPPNSSECPSSASETPSPSPSETPSPSPPESSSSLPSAYDGTTTSTACSISDDTSCAKDGSTNECYRSLTYDASTGKFTGTITSNDCANHPYAIVDGTQYSMKHTSTCRTQQFPDPAYASGPNGASLMGMVGMSISGGARIYGPFEMGFEDGLACTGGDCSAGVDVPMCDAELHFECDSGTLNEGMMMDDCGGHAIPYHYHMDMSCLYTAHSTNHASVIGIAFDGYGIYGANDFDMKEPVLDACGGHFGTVPDDSTYGVSSSCVYHYHTSSTKAPYTLGCFGPVSSLSECKALYSDYCDTGYETITTATGTVEYDLWCPCYDHNDNSATCDATATSVTTPTTTPDTTPLPSTKSEALVYIKGRIAFLGPIENCILDVTARSSTATTRVIQTESTVGGYFGVGFDAFNGQWDPSNGADDVTFTVSMSATQARTIEDRYTGFEVLATLKGTRTVLVGGQDVDEEGYQVIEMNVNALTTMAGPLPIFSSSSLPSASARKLLENVPAPTYYGKDATLVDHLDREAWGSETAQHAAQVDYLSTYSMFINTCSTMTSYLAPQGTNQTDYIFSAISAYFEANVGDSFDLTSQSSREPIYNLMANVVGTYKDAYEADSRKSHYLHHVSLFHPRPRPAPQLLDPSIPQQALTDPRAS